jgi:hypothetical protein
MSLKNAHKQDVYDISDISDIEKTSWRRGEVFNCYLSLSPTLKLHDENKDGTASTGYFDGFHWGEGKHPWVKGIPHRRHRSK